MYADIEICESSKTIESDVVVWGLFSVNPNQKRT